MQHVTRLGNMPAAYLDRHITALAERLQQGIMSQLDSVVINGPASMEQRYVGNLNMSFSYVEGESLIMGLKVRSSSEMLAAAPTLLAQADSAISSAVGIATWS